MMMKNGFILNKYNYLLILALFFVLFQPPIISVNFLNIVGILSFLYLVFKSVHNDKLVIFKEERIIILLFLFLFIYVLLFEVIINRASPYSSITPIRYIVFIIPFGVLLSDYLNKKGYTINDFVEMSILASAIELLLGLLAFFFLTVHHLFANLLYVNGYGDIIYSLVNNRIFGLADGLMFATPILLTIMGIIIFFYNRFKIISILVGSIFIALGVINARVSIVVAIIGFIIIIIFKDSSNKRKSIAIVSIILGLIFSLIFVFPIVERRFPLTYEWITSGFEELKLFSKGDRVGYFEYFSDKSHYTLPSSVYGFLFGVGKGTIYGFANQGVYIQSDIGYINDIWFGGIIYLFILYGCFAFMLYKLFSSNVNIVKFISLFFMILLPIVNFKGLAFGFQQLTIFVVLLFIIHGRTNAKGMKQYE